MDTVYYSIAIHLSFPFIHLTDVHCSDTMYSAGLDAGSVDDRFSSKYCFITVFNHFSFPPIHLTDVQMYYLVWTRVL
jgi:hypothetical protein